MSGNTQQSGGSTVNKEETARLVQRRARARSHPEGMPDPQPSRADISMDADAFFDGGSLKDASQVMRDAEEHEDVESVESRLRNRRPGVVREINDLTDDGETTYVGATKADLVKHHVRELFDEKGLDEPNFDGVPILDEDADEQSLQTAFEMSIPQEPDINRLSTMEDVSLTLDDEGTGEECPECESKHTTSYQQQTGGADEGMTSFHKCVKCGHSWRGGYGG